MSEKKVLSKTAIVMTLLVAILIVFSMIKLEFFKQTKNDESPITAKPVLNLQSGSSPTYSQCANDITYYFSSSTGNDANNGLSTSSPKQTLAEAGRLLALTNAQRPHCVLFMRGDTWTDSYRGTEALPLGSLHGNSSSWAVISSYGAGTAPVIDPNMNGTSSRQVIKLFGGGTSVQNPTVAFIIVDGINITTSLQPGQRPTQGIVISGNNNGPHDIIFRNLIVENLESGLELQNADNITFEDSFVHNNLPIAPETGLAQGLYTHEITNLLVKNNLFDHNGEDNEWFDHNMYHSNCTNCLIEGNELRNSLDGMKFRRGNNITVRNNVIHNMTLSSIIAGSDAGVPFNNVIIENNNIYNTSQGINIVAQSSGINNVSNLIVRNNLMHDNKVGPTYGVGPTYSTLAFGVYNNISIYNNIFYNIDGPIISGTSIHNKYVFETDIQAATPNNARNISIKNNIFYNPSNTARALLRTTASDLSLIDFDNNLYYSGGNGGITNIISTYYTNLTTFRSTYQTFEIHGLQADPKLVNPTNEDYHLQSSSPAIDNGATINNNGGEDYYGNNRPLGNAWDIGPYEYGGSASPLCTSFTYSSWSTCTSNLQTRTVTSSSPSSCTGGSPVLSQTCGTITVCGNGVLESGEQCDDGNTANSDGCTASCTYEQFTVNFTGNTTNLTGINLSGATNFQIQNPGKGLIKFIQALNFLGGSSGGNLSKLANYMNQYIKINQKSIIVDSQNVPEFNTSATLTLYGLTETNPKILMDGTECPQTICQIQSYSGGVLVFNVSHFTNYTITEEKTTESNTTDNQEIILEIIIVLAVIAITVSRNRLSKAVRKATSKVYNKKKRNK